MKIAVGFDLHNTIMISNEAWIEAYIELSGEENQAYIINKVYGKYSRREIARSLGVEYEKVLKIYHQKVKPDEKMCKLIKALKGRVPIYLISSASIDKVKNDLLSWDGESFFDRILTKENFDKRCVRDWEQLISCEQLDLLIYIGNDIEEDVVENDRILSLIFGDFLEKLLEMNLLLHRGEPDEFIYGFTGN